MPQKGSGSASQVQNIIFNNIINNNNNNIHLKQEQGKIILFVDKVIQINAALYHSNQKLHANSVQNYWHGNKIFAKCTAMSAYTVLAEWRHSLLPGML